MIWQTLLGALAGIGTLIGAIIGGVKVYRASQETARISAVDGFNRLVEALEGRLASVEKSLDKAYGRIAILESQGDIDQAEIQELRQYIAYLQRFIGEHAPLQFFRELPFIEVFRLAEVCIQVRCSSARSGASSCSGTTPRTASWVVAASQRRRHRRQRHHRRQVGPDPLRRSAPQRPLAALVGLPGNPRRDPDVEVVRAGERPPGQERALEIVVEAFDHALGLRVPRAAHDHLRAQDTPECLTVPGQLLPLGPPPPDRALPVRHQHPRHRTQGGDQLPPPDRDLDVGEPEVALRDLPGHVRRA